MSQTIVKENTTEQPYQADSFSEQSRLHELCALPEVPERVFEREVNPDRAELIRVIDKKWVNGTVLHFYFFDRPTDGETVFFQNGTSEFRKWTTTEPEKEVVRRALNVWSNLDIGLQFKEVRSRDEAEIRIGFMRGDGAWSYIGRDIIDLGIGRDERTMNFGWDLTRNPDEVHTAIHEIGHTMGFPHEHQNPNAGMVWDEEAVYAALAQPPNRWSREKTLHNIIRKIAPDTVQGSNWDPNSVMHYPFGPGLIKEPAQYRNGLFPAGGLSERDRTWAKTFYPPLDDADNKELKPAESVKLAIKPGEQRNFVITPKATRYYEFGTFGTSDTVLVLFENRDGEPRYLTGDDDSGEDRNAHIRIKLTSGRKYVLRVRLYYTNSAGETAVMLW